MPDRTPGDLGRRTSRCLHTVACCVRRQHGRRAPAQPSSTSRRSRRPTARVELARRGDEAERTDLEERRAQRDPRIVALVDRLVRVVADERMRSEQLDQERDVEVGVLDPRVVHGALERQRQIADGLARRRECGQRLRGRVRAERLLHRVALVGDRHATGPRRVRAADRADLATERALHEHGDAAEPGEVRRGVLALGREHALLDVIAQVVRVVRGDRRRTASSKCATSGWSAQFTSVPIVGVGSLTLTNRAIVSVGSKITGSRMSLSKSSVFDVRGIVDEQGRRDHHLRGLRGGHRILDRRDTPRTSASTTNGWRPVTATWGPHRPIVSGASCACVEPIMM